MESPEVMEPRIRRACEAGQVDAAMRAALETYGDEVFSFLVARLRDDDIAGDVFAQACEDLLVTLPTFQWRCTLRTWFYRVARSAAARHLRSPMNRAERRVPLSDVSEIADQIRSRTMAHLRSEVKDGIRALRDQLDSDEQQLLMLRIDRDLSWNEIAQIIEDTDDDGEIAKASARLRQQFAKLKNRLRELALEQGLLGAE